MRSYQVQLERKNECYEIGFINKAQKAFLDLSNAMFAE